MTTVRLLLNVWMSYFFSGSRPDWHVLIPHGPNIIALGAKFGPRARVWYPCLRHLDCFMYRAFFCCCLFWSLLDTMESLEDNWDAYVPPCHLFFPVSGSMSHGLQLPFTEISNISIIPPSKKIQGEASQTLFSSNRTRQIVCIYTGLSFTDNDGLYPSNWRTEMLPLWN